MTPSGIEPATFRFVAQYLNHCAAAVLTVKMHIHKLIMNVGLGFFYTLMGYTSSSELHRHQTEMSLVRLSPATQPSY
jgi:hypothetical protein